MFWTYEERRPGSRHLHEFLQVIGSAVDHVLVYQLPEDYFGAFAIRQGRGESTPECMLGVMMPQRFIVNRCKEGRVLWF